LNFLAQEGYLKKPEFINYLKYLEVITLCASLLLNFTFKYWKDPKYAKLIRYPTCLRFLELLLDSHFREAIAMARNAKEIDDQVIFLII